MNSGSYLLGVRCQLSPRPSPFPLRCPMLSLWLTVMLTLPLFPVSLCACVPEVCSRPCPFRPCWDMRARPLCRARVTQQLCHALLPCPNHGRLQPVTKSDHRPRTFHPLPLSNILGLWRVGEPSPALVGLLLMADLESVIITFTISLFQI